MHCKCKLTQDMVQTCGL